MPPVTQLAYTQRRFLQERVFTIVPALFSLCFGPSSQLHLDVVDLMDLLHPLVLKVYTVRVPGWSIKRFAHGKSRRP